MNELLTTGEMIDQLKVGQIAENENGYRVTVNKFGGIGNEEDPMNSCILNGIVVSSNWHILPNYVSFEEAMQALKDGKDITFHGKRGTSELTYSVIEEPLEELILGRYSLDELFEGKWTIEGY